MVFAEADARQLLEQLFRTAVDAAHPDVLVPGAIAGLSGPVLVVGAGKAAAQMAAAVEANWDGPVEGLVITRYGHGAPTRHVEVVEAAHPVPDAAGLAATRRLVETVRAAPADRFVLVLISGGGSSLLTMPPPAIPFEEKMRIGAALIRSSAAIGEINTVRKQLSAIKGGGLAAAIAPRRSLTLVISDVPGDDPAVVASGPTLPPGSTAADALAILDRHAIPLAPATRAFLQGGGVPPPPPEAFAAGTCRLIGSPQMSLEAAARAASAAGFRPVILSDALEGEARDVGRVHAGLAAAVAAGRGLGPAPLAILSGGETTVTLRGPGGRGGRNGEFLLGLAAQLGGLEGVHALAADTDGIDGSQDNAGAMVLPSTFSRARAAGLDIRDHLAGNDSWGFFSGLGDLVVTGPTGTNVNDFRAILVGRPGRQ